jgi:hypothetical protein
VIAGVEVAGVLEGQGVAALAPERAQRRLAVDIGGQDVVEEGDEDRADVAPHPFIEDPDEEAAVRGRLDRAVREPRSLLFVGLVLALNDGNELDVARPELVAEEAVDFERMEAVRGVDGAQDVELDAVLVHQARRPDGGRNRFLARIAAVGVVKLARAVGG